MFTQKTKKLFASVFITASVIGGVGIFAVSSPIPAPQIAYAGSHGSAGGSPSHVTDPLAAPDGSTSSDPWYIQIGSWLGNLLGGAVGGLALYAFTLLLYPFTLLLIPFVTLSGWIFEFSLYNFVLRMGVWIGSNNAQGIREAWTIVRDIANIGIIAGLVATAIGTIIRSANWDINKNLARLIIAALLVNFSFFFAGAIIDASNITTNIIYKQMIQGKHCPFYLIGGISECTISGRFIDVVNPSLFVLVPRVDLLAGSPQTGKPGVAFLNAQMSVLFSVIMTLVFQFVVMWVLLTVAAMFVARYVVLIILLVTSPIGIAGGAVPILKEYAKEWWTALITQSIFAPIYMLIASISLRIIELSKASTYVGADVAGGVVSGGASSMAGTVITFTVATGFMIASLRIAQDLSKKAARFQGVYKYANDYLNFTKPIVGTAWRATGGWAAETAKYAYNKRIAPFLNESPWVNPKFGFTVPKSILGVKVPFVGGKRFEKQAALGKGLDRAIAGRIQAVRAAKPFGVQSYEETKKEQRARDSEVTRIKEGEEKHKKLRQGEDKKNELNGKEQELDADLQSPDTKHAGDKTDPAFNKRKRQAGESMEDYKRRREIDLGLVGWKDDKGVEHKGLRDKVGLLYQREEAEGRQSALVADERNRRGTRYVHDVKTGKFQTKDGRWVTEDEIRSLDELTVDTGKDANGNFTGKLLAADFDRVSEKHRKYQVNADTGDYAFHEVNERGEVVFTNADGTVGTDKTGTAAVLSKMQIESTIAGGGKWDKDANGRWALKDTNGKVVGAMLEDWEKDEKGGFVYRDLDGNATDAQHGQRSYSKAGRALFKSKAKGGWEMYDESPYEFQQRMEDRSGLRVIRDESSGIFADLDPAMIEYWYDENPEKIVDLARAWSTHQMKSIVESKDFSKGIRNEMINKRSEGLVKLANYVEGRLKIDKNKQSYKDGNDETKWRWKKWKDEKGVEHDPDIEQFSPEHGALKTLIYFQTRNVYSKEDLVEFGVNDDTLLTNEAYIDAMLSSKMRDLQDDPRISVAIKRKMRNIRRLRYRSGYNMADYGVLGLSDTSGSGDDDYGANSTLATMVNPDQQRRAIDTANGVLARSDSKPEEKAAAHLVLARLAANEKEREKHLKDMSGDDQAAGRRHLKEQVRTGDERVRRYMAGKTGEEIYREVRQEDLGNLWIAKNISVNQRQAQHERDQNWLTTLDRNIFVVGRDGARQWMLTNPDGETATGGRTQVEIDEANALRRKLGYTTKIRGETSDSDSGSGSGSGTSGTPGSGTPEASRVSQRRLVERAPDEAATRITELEQQYKKPPANPGEALQRIATAVEALPTKDRGTPAGGAASKRASDIIDAAVDAVPEELLPDLGESLERPEVVITLTLGQLRAVLLDKKKITNKTKRAIIVIVGANTMRHDDAEIRKWLNGDEGQRIEKGLRRP